MRCILLLHEARQGLLYVYIHTYIHNMLQSVLFWNVCLQITTFLQPSLWSQYTYLSKNLPECEVTDMHAYIICMLCKWDFLFHGISKSGIQVYV